MVQDSGIVFFGTPSFAAAHLRALVEANEYVAGVVSRPDKPKGRGRKPMPSPVKQFAVENGMDFIQPHKPNEPETVEWLKKKTPWIIVTVAYGRIISREILDVPSEGAWNVHASLLPGWRGAAPVARAVQHGDTRAGVTIMQMDEGLDTGDILLQSETDIGSDETAGELEDRLEKMGCNLLIEALKLARSGKIEPRPQPEEGVTLAPPIAKEEAEIDWNRPASYLHNHIRAMSPRPGARTGDLKIFRSRIKEGAASGSPGTIKEIDSSGIVMNTGKGLISIVELQPPGKRRMSAADFARGRKQAPGDTIHC